MASHVMEKPVFIAWRSPDRISGALRPRIPKTPIEAPRRMWLIACDILRKGITWAFA
jgi:hypothetical protein